MTAMHLPKARHDGHFHERIRYLRLREGMNQVETAHLAGIDIRTYRGWEAGRSVPLPGPSLRALATSFRVTPLYLLHGED